MSGFSGSINCPNCGADCDEYTDWKPFNYTCIQCVECGLMIDPKVEYMDLDDLNMEREERNLKPLNKIPKQEFKF